MIRADSVGHLTFGNAAIGYSASTAAPTNGLSVSGTVNIGTNTSVTTAALQVSSTTQGFLPPVMTTTQKNAIATPASGLIVYDTTLNALNFYNGSSWSSGGGGGGMVYPAAGIALSTGSAWGTSITNNSADWNTAYTNRITSLTTTGSGAATLISNVLNIPTPSAATITLSGNVTGTGTTAITTTIAANVVTNAMLAQVATSTIQGRVTAGTGNVETLTGTQATTLIDTFTSTLKGLAPASGGGTANFLRADGTWAAPGGGGGGVTQIVAGTNVTISPAGGTGVVTINASGGGGGGTEIGAQIGGGIVVAVFNDAGVNKALVASLTNLSSGIQWTIPAFQTTLIGATAQSYSDGLTNTKLSMIVTLNCIHPVLHSYLEYVSR